MSREQEILEKGVDAWNEWRNANPSAAPSLRDVDLSGRDLRGANLSEADLSGADLDGADLTNANLKMAKLEGADLAGAILHHAELYKAELGGIFAVAADMSDAYLAEAVMIGADLRGVTMRSTYLAQADLTDACLVGADLSGADLTGADVRGADLSQARVEEVNVSDLRYGPFRSMRGRYFGIRGLESCYGNALFVRDAQDQDYLETLRRAIDQTPSPWIRRAKRFAFSAWSLIDFGRSLAKPAVYAMVLALGFGILYSFDAAYEWGLMDYSGSADSPISPIYYSIVTYTTLGFGDITPLNWAGEMVVVAEVVLGYTTLGLLLSILANRVARQS
jgi:uncharacterized protein YjbI with pentapeptide repeats